MNTSNFTMESLDDFNEQSFQFRLPALVFLATLLPIGILGNASVIYIFGLRLKPNNVYLFITLLAVADIICCLVAIPMEIYRMIFFYNYPYIAACKIGTFIAFACFLCSVLMLFIISVERYVRVCRSTGTQMSGAVAKVLAGAVFLVSGLLALPVPLLADADPYALDNGTIVHCCFYRLKPKLLLYWYTIIAFVSGILAAMFGLYSRVLKVAKEHTAASQQRAILGLLSPDALHLAQQRVIEKEKMLRRTNWQVISISLVYMISSIPNACAAMIITHVTQHKAPNSMDALLFLLFEGWIVNCTVNPLVYGFLNHEFRTEVLNLFRKCR